MGFNNKQFFTSLIILAIVASSFYYLYTTNKPEIPDCTKFTNQTQNILCNFNVAVLTKNVTICTNMPNQNAKNDCYITFFSEINSSSICKKIQGNLIYDCYYFYAMQHNSKICSEIKNQSMVNLCYYYIARDKKDESLCKKMSNWTDICYYTLAEAKQNVSICNYIQNTSDKDYCTAKVKELSGLATYNECDKLTDKMERYGCYIRNANNKSTSTLSGVLNS
ncbi:MAG: hypothetical protein Q7S33_02805 [Nanoarchaeota archaeon]|nr:hypothetical protein [Nanoarchaeota archaeon]